jgi:hypothetical protein
MDHRVIGERSDAVLRTAMPGGDEEEVRCLTLWIGNENGSKSRSSTRLGRSKEWRIDSRPIFPGTCNRGLLGITLKTGGAHHDQNFAENFAVAARHHRIERIGRGWCLCPSRRRRQMRQGVGLSRVSPAHMRGMRQWSERMRPLGLRAARVRDSDLPEVRTPRASSFALKSETSDLR